MSKFISTVFLLLSTAPSLLPEVTALCPDNCQPNGNCVNGQCQCDAGFAGVDCSFPYEVCPDGVTSCFNGAACVEDGFPDVTTGIQAYKCNCQTAYGDSFVDGTECEHPQSAVCEEGADQSDYAFCTNGGECISFVKRGENHAGCKCTNDFEGRHCQYESGKAPRGELYVASKYATEREGHVASGVTIFFVLVVVGGVVGYFGHVTFHKWQRTKHLYVTPDHIQVEAQLRDLKMTQSTDEEDIMTTTGDEIPPVSGGVMG